MSEKIDLHHYSVNYQHCTAYWVLKDLCQILGSENVMAAVKEIQEERCPICDQLYIINGELPPLETEEEHLARLAATQQRCTLLPMEGRDE